MRPLLLLALTACGGSTTPTPTGHTGHTGTLQVVDESWAMCATYTYDDPPSFTATSPAASTIDLDYRGTVGGCGCDGVVRPALDDASGRIDVRFDAGACDGLFCCEIQATLGGVPTGTWELHTTGYPGTSATVAVD